MYFARHLPSSDMTRTLTTPQYFSRPLLMHHYPNYPSSLTLTTRHPTLTPLDTLICCPLDKRKHWNNEICDDDVGDGSCSDDNCKDVQGGVCVAGDDVGR